MPLTGSSGHLDFSSLMGITLCLALCYSSPSPLPLQNHSPVPEGSEQFSDKYRSHSDLGCIWEQDTWYWLPSPLHAVFEKGCCVRIHAFSLPQTTCYLSVLPVKYRAFVWITSPFWHVPSSSQALYIITSNCVFAMAAWRTSVIGSMLLFLPQGMES